MHKLLIVDDEPGIRDSLAGVLEDELALLRIEQRESLVEQHLSHISFDLGEIRIDSPVECEILPDSPPRITA